MKKQFDAKDFAATVKTIGIAKSAKGLASSIIWAAIITAASIYLMSIGIPKIIGFAIITVFAGIILIEALQLKRAYSVDTRPDGSNDGCAQVGIQPDEVLEDYIAGIQRYGWGAGSYAVLGTGKNHTPENALLITNKNIWAVTVPLEGAGKVISGTDISMWQCMTMQKEIEGILKGMLAAMTLEELIMTCGKHVLIPRDDIVQVKKSDISFGITFITRSRKKYSYSIRNKEDYEKAKKML